MPERAGDCPLFLFSCGREPTLPELPSGHRPGMNGQREDRRSGAAAPCRCKACGTRFARLNCLT